MGRAYRYQRRMAHIEIALAERVRAEANGTATVVGEESTSKKRRTPARAAARKKTASKKAKAKG
jgi:large subunit ribosomal protein L22